MFRRTSTPSSVTSPATDPVADSESAPAKPNLLQRHSLIVFFGLAYLIAWSASAAESGLLPTHLPVPFLDFLVNWAPGFAAFIVVAGLGGLRGIRSLLRPLLTWRVSPSWYTVALLLTPVLLLAAIGIAILFGQPVPQFGRAFGPQLALLPVLFLFNMGEEIGWRGFALPRLQLRKSALVASLTLGVIWGLWHAPKFFFGGQGMSALPVFLAYLVSVLAETILLTWIYNNTRGSLLLVTLFHFSSDAFLLFFLPAWTTPAGLPLIFAIMTVLQLIVVALVLLRYGPKRLSRTSPVATPQLAG